MDNYLHKASLSVIDVYNYEVFIGVPILEDLVQIRVARKRRISRRPSARFAVPSGAYWHFGTLRQPRIGWLRSVVVWRMLHLKPTWLYERTRKNAIPHHRFGKYIRFTEADLVDIITMASQPDSPSEARKNN